METVPPVLTQQFTDWSQSLHDPTGFPSEPIICRLAIIIQAVSDLMELFEFLASRDENPSEGKSSEGKPVRTEREGEIDEKER